MEDRHDLHRRLVRLREVRIAAARVTDDADVGREINRVHLTQLTRTADGLQYRHCHRHFDVALYGAGGVLFDEHGERRNKHRVQFAGYALCKAVVVRSDETQLLVFHPLLERHYVFRHIPYFIYRAAAFNLERIEYILCLRADSRLVGHMVGDSPHLLPVELLGIEPHTVVEVRLVDIQVHHTGIGTTDLGDVRIAETAAHLCGAAPVFYLALYLGVFALQTGDDGMTLARTLQVGYHLAHCAAGVQFTQPCGCIRVLVVRRRQFLHVH